MNRRAFLATTLIAPIAAAIEKAAPTPVPKPCFGLIVYINSFGANGEWLDLAFTVAPHPCQSVSAVLFDGKAFQFPAAGPNRCSMRRAANGSTLVRLRLRHDPQTFAYGIPQVSFIGRT